jgi:hypothetical protein
VLRCFSQYHKDDFVNLSKTSGFADDFEVVPDKKHAPNMVTPMGLGSDPMLSIECMLPEESSNILGWSRTGPVLVLLHTGEFNPGDHFWPTSYASAGLIRLASYGETETLRLELIGWYGPKIFGEMMELPAMGLLGTVKRVIHPDEYYSMITVITKIDPSQSLYATATLNCQEGETQSKLWVYDTNTTREKFPANEPRQGAIAFNRITNHTIRGKLSTIGQITIE